MITFKQFIAEAVIKNENGRLEYGWKTDLEDEEEEGYIPTGYSKKVLELKVVNAKEVGKGMGDKLIRQFLDTTDAKKAELIFLDPVPGMGDVQASNDEQIKKLMSLYRKYGFRNNPKSNRMWLVQKGHIPDDKLPT